MPVGLFLADDVKKDPTNNIFITSLDKKLEGITFKLEEKYKAPSG